jgi:glycosyltransferase involved in cell wall biosynthesis
MHRKKISILFGADSTLEWGRSFQLAKAFKALGHDVLYIDLPTPLADSVFKPTLAKEVSDVKGFSIFKPSYGLPYGRFKWLRPINKLIVLRQIRNALERMNFIPTVLWIYSPYEPGIARVICDELKPQCIIYDCADDRIAHAEIRGGPKAGIKLERLEKELVKFCDAVIVITDNLKRKKSFLHKTIFVIPNGIDTDMFSATSELRKPGEYIRIEGKIILYIGTIDKWIDLNLVALCAKRYQEYRFVLIGPANVDTTIFKNIGNVNLFGPRKYTDIPAYIYYSDLCIIPFQNNEVTKSCDPLKVLQYLSMGKPVVSTYYDGVNSYEGLVAIARTENEFQEKIELLLKSESMKEADAIRKRILGEYSWKTLASRALHTIDTNLHGSG